jgi:hypothetical protein
VQEAVKHALDTAISTLQRLANERADLAKSAAAPPHSAPGAVSGSFDASVNALASADSSSLDLADAAAGGKGGAVQRLKQLFGDERKVYLQLHEVLLKTARTC